jgi:hypothetical protein
MTQRNIPVTKNSAAIRSAMMQRLDRIIDFIEILFSFFCEGENAGYSTHL